jgi:hypothetical protein
MKKIVFTLITVFALVILADSVKAQTAIAPYIGETYSYTLGGITVLNASTAVVTYSGTNVTLPADIAITVGANKSITFSVTYNSGATEGDLTVTITDGITNCDNFINLHIIPTVPPTLELAVTTTSDAEICQNKNSSPANNNAANIGAANNTFTFIVTPAITGSLPVGATYSFDFDLNDYSFGATAITIEHTSGDGAPSVSGPSGSLISITDASANTPVAQVFTVTFATTTGLVNQTITGTASSAVLQSNSSATDPNFDGTYDPSAASVVVKSMPAIGTFTY